MLDGRHALVRWLTAERDQRPVLWPRYEASASRLRASHRIDLFELGVDVGFADVKHTAFSVCAFEPQVAVASE